MLIFTVELAGIPVAIRCRYEENREFLKAYLSEKMPLFSVEPAESDLQRIQAEFGRMDIMGGICPYKRVDTYLENNAIHALLADKLVNYNVLLMHGSALCMDGQAVIFTAPSGTGKSTHARLWREVFGDRVWMINDDKPLLRISEDEVRVYGTPWDGKHRLSCNKSASLKAIVRLERGKKNSIAALQRADAFSLLIRQAYACGNRETMRKITELEMKLLNNTEVQFYGLSCTMEREAVQIAWQEIFMGDTH